MMPVLQVIAGGFMTTVQDLGRFGAQALGMPVAGALDPISLRLANTLVGNDERAAGLEIRLQGPTMRTAQAPVRLALVGTSAVIDVLSPDPKTLPAGRSAVLQPGSVFKIGSTTDTGVCYLAVAGSFALDPAFGSLSTYMPAAIGGLQGRPLKEDDRLEIGSAIDPNRGEKQLSRNTQIEKPSSVRVVLGPQDDRFTAQAIETFLGTHYRVSATSNRMGLRLDGEKLNHRAGHDLPSDGIVTGSIQVPGTGLPIILLADRQTTGGYPKIATVISSDLPGLGRLLPGENIRFAAVSVDEAEAIRRRQEATIRQWISDIAAVELDPAALNKLLLSENLISGVVRA